MTMRTVHFKNGTKREIDQEIANTLREAILQGILMFQIFSEENGQKVGDAFLFINIQEIVYID